MSKTPKELAEEAYKVGFARGRLMTKEEFNRTVEMIQWSPNLSCIMTWLFCALTFGFGLIIGGCK
jgi:hypothetical protein